MKDCLDFPWKALTCASNSILPFSQLLRGSEKVINKNRLILWSLLTPEEETPPQMKYLVLCLFIWMKSKQVLVFVRRIGSFCFPPFAVVVKISLSNTYFWRSLTSPNFLHSLLTEQCHPSLSTIWSVADPCNFVIFRSFDSFLYYA